MDEMENSHRATVQVLRTNRSRSKERRIDYLWRITNRQISFRFTTTRDQGCLFTIHSEARQELSTKEKQRLHQIPIRKPFSRADEIMAKYYARLHDIAKKCEFNDEDETIRDHLIKTKNTNRIRVETIRNNWTLSKTLDEAAVEEESTAQAHDIDKKLHDAMEFQKIKQITKDNHDRSATCYRCGSKHMRGNCKAYGAKCFKCGKWNHHTWMCRSPDSKDRTEEKREKSSHRDDKKEDSPRGSRHARLPTVNQHSHQQVRHVQWEDTQERSTKAELIEETGYESRRTSND